MVWHPQLRHLGLALAAVHCAATAQPARPDSAAPNATPNAEIQRREGQRLRELQEQATPRVDVLTPAPAAAAPDLAALPAQSPCFVIRQIELPTAPFPWLRDAAAPVIGQCVGAAGLKAARDALNNVLIDRGYVTSRVLLPEQDLSGGTLRLDVLPGRIGAIRVDAEVAPAVGWQAMALPAGPGDLLNQRDLDQALENVRRLEGQFGTTFDLVPGVQAGLTDIIIRPAGADGAAGKRWHASVSTDNSGIESTGKYQLSGTFTLDSPLFLYDQLTLSANTNADRSNDHAGARATGLNYSVPVGYASVFASASRSRYKQTIAGFFEPIVYSGQSTDVSVGVGFEPYRGTRAKTDARIKLYRRISRSAINGDDNPSQHRDVTGVEVSLAHRQYAGAAVLDGAVSYRQSLLGMTHKTGYALGAPFDYRGRSQILTAYASAQVPFRLGAQALSWQSTWSTQRAYTLLNPNDFFSIGSRYSVRGFDGQLTLSAENGWTWRNELAWMLGQHAVFAGVDVGKVHGPSTAALIGHKLAGAFVGVRGRIPATCYVQLAYELMLGVPVDRPAGFPTDKPAVFGQVTALF